MINDKVQAIILAAGKSTRFNTDSSKLVERICGKEMIVHTTSLLKKMHIPTTLVVGHKKELVEAAVKKHHPKGHFNFVHQTEQLGTGHALQCTKQAWTKEHILVMNGDTPLLSEDLLQRLIDKHVGTDAAMSFLVAHNVDPSIQGYGLVVNQNNQIKIIEEEHLEEEHDDLYNLNGGLYLLKRTFLEKYIDSLPRDKQSGEVYLTTLAEIASDNGLTISIVDAPFDEVRGVNTQRELWVAEQIKRSQIIDYWMKQGVRFSAAQNVHLDETVTIGNGTYIGNGVQLFGKTTIGKKCSICAFNILNNAKLGDNCLVRPHTIIKESAIGDNCMINSFTYIHEGSIIQNNCAVGSFNEICGEIISQNTKTSKKNERTFVAAFKTCADRSFSDTI
ncbi:TPA: hypothetical protein DIC20_00445 [Candidatus Dependentiae bacterium]|nr:MAG: Bifunctional protein GlmU [candidate division TM6 bacterium GW2011_GWF2_36_131]KKQ03494.1 MAG: Bifunctional protein GlmU [candidate division TM6 bacterium GW2011_GWE2_36_25]KKQ20232.1 MAG: Bifunctional protein GlmU [candidate division TM6 bacterium GW2011_GWA2_36_9]HBR70771.1 hypothetical protein [Candidatus Dependentiae bacterium]HCU00156.1 hypothetical protein [Candidatus Dependentiae bacterium]